MPTSPMEATVTNWEIVAMSPVATPRPPVAQHAYTLPVVRELPPVPRPGTFAATW